MAITCDCDDDRVPGAFWPCASDGDDAHPFVERCDTCRRFPDDVAAAEAVSTATGHPIQWANVHDQPGRAQPYVEPSLTRTIEINAARRAASEEASRLGRAPSSGY